MRKTLFISSFLLFATSLIAQNVSTGGKENLIIKGFISTTLFAQNQLFEFGNGQNAEWTATNNTRNQWFYGGDVRNSRMTMIFNGPKISSDWKLGGVLEFDAFGGFNGTGAFSPEQPLTRLRLAYADIISENLTIRIGQAWTPLFGNVPVSLSHIAFPLGYGTAGDVGWRFPGIFFYYKFNSNGSPTHFGLDAAVFEGSWSGPGSPVTYTDGGNVGTPQIELRLNLESKISDESNFTAYVVGHYDQVNLAPINTTPSVNLTGTAFEVGARLKAGDFLVQGNLYSGKNIGQQFGNMTQFATAASDLSSVGFWLQLGYNFTKEWALYGFYGSENVNKDQAKLLFGNSARLSNNLFDIMVKYQTGPFGIGIELLQSNLTYGLNESSQNGTQIAFSSMYSF
ncbi:MAG: hypothetical protein ACYCVH_08995 [Ignavibacteriaceae bacterium]